jgi:DNA-cytosine methyltransferase
MNNKKNILSLFDGISCGRVALNRSDISVGTYYASEIDKYATTVSEKNYPDIVRLGDVTKWESWDIDFSSIDIVFAGFPCQSWSLAGQQLADKDPRGMLFWTTLDVISKVLEANPNAKFIMENVKMKKEFEEYITFHTREALGEVNKYIINSSLVSAQNRNRFYWTNIKEVEQPEDKGLLLKDIVEDKTVYWGAAKRGRYKKDGSGTYQQLEFNQTERSNALTTVQKDSLVLSDKAIGYMNRHRNGKPRWTYHTNKLEGKAACLTANMFKGVPYGVLEEYCRRLSPIECERLQTLPDGYTEGVSNTQRFKMLGNGWTVDVVAHILKYIND